MNANSIAQRTLTRLNHGDVIGRMQRFLYDPANFETPAYNRLCELLETARQRKESAENGR